MASGVTVPNNFMSCDGIGRNSTKQFEDFYHSHQEQPETVMGDVL